MSDKTSRILLGQIGAAHGIKGEVRITTHTQDPLAIASYGPLDTDAVVAVETIRPEPAVTER